MTNWQKKKKCDLCRLDKHSEHILTTIPNCLYPQLELNIEHLSELLANQKPLMMRHGARIQSIEGFLKRQRLKADAVH